MIYIIFFLALTLSFINLIYLISSIVFIIPSEDYDKLTVEDEEDGDGYLFIDVISPVRHITLFVFTAFLWTLFYYFTHF